MKSVLIKKKDLKEQTVDVLDEALGWFRNQAQERAHGTVTLRAVLHDGRIARFDRSISDRSYTLGHYPDGIGGFDA